MTVPNLSEARQKLDSGVLSAEDLLAACLDRIEATEPEVRAWLHIDRDGAMEAARKADSADAGPLSGIPLGIKDIIDVAGMPTTAASKVLAGNIATRDAPIVSRLREAGGIVLGKTNLQEFAYGYVTPPTANPWDHDRIPGGSSGGTGAAIALGHCLGGLGTDTGGSIRVPSALCGITGLKPAFGEVPIEGIIPLAPTLDVVGPMARTVEDILLMWHALTAQAQVLPDGPFKIGVCDSRALPELDPAIQSAFEEAIDVMGSSGSLIEIGVPPFEEFDLPRATIIMPEALEVHRKNGWWPDKAHLYTDETRTYLEFAESHMPTEMVEAGLAEAKRVIGDLRKALDEVDVLLTPSSPILPPTHAEAALVEDGELRRPVAMTLGRLQGPVNMVGAPALAVPMRPSAEGLPTSLQIVGLSTTSVLAAGRYYQRQTSWHELRPPV
jgi:aspartyl-tRNA(Asn)/glutamyl-tRNA(Gln) amidotransferase subunit A